VKRAVVGSAAALIALTAVGFAASPRTAATSIEVEQERALGPDSARVAKFLDALAAADPIVCELVSDQIGNFWWGDEMLGIGRVSDARTAMRAAKDSVSRRVRDPAAIRLLASRLDAEDPCLRTTAAKMLGNSSASDDVIERLLDAPSARVREAALRSIGANSRPELRGKVERMLGAREPNVAAMAAYALGEIEMRASVGPLKRVLDNEHALVRLNAAHALGQIEDVSAAPELEALALRDGDRRVRLVSVRALGELESRRSLETLLRVLETRDVELQIAAVEAISQIDELVSAPPALVQAASSPNQELRQAALYTLVHIEDPTLAPVLLAHITDADADVRTHIIAWMGEMKAQSALPAIRRALNDPVAEVRRAAVEALAEISERDE
jgi:HEAT repeat protein